MSDYIALRYDCYVTFPKLQERGFFFLFSFLLPIYLSYPETSLFCLFFTIPARVFEKMTEAALLLPSFFLQSITESQKLSIVK